MFESARKDHSIPLLLLIKTVIVNIFFSLSTIPGKKKVLVQEL